MISLSKAITNEEVETAAAYFSAPQPPKRIGGAIDRPKNVPDGLQNRYLARG
jgi:hypothetical protein